MDESLPPRSIPVLPKRYEDTKPALNQAFTHDAIIDIGNKIVIRSEQINSFEKSLALQKCESDLWKKAEEYKNKCVEEALRRAKTKEDKRVERLHQQHEILLRKEISRVEGIMQQLIAEKMYETRIAGENKLNEVVAKLHATFAIDKGTTILRIQDEEKSIAKQASRKLTSQHLVEIEELKARDEEHELLKLEELRVAMTEAKNQAVMEENQRGEEAADERVREVTDRFNGIVQAFQEVVNEKEEKQNRTEQALNAMEKLKNSYVEKLKETKMAFLSFAEASRPDFSKNQADFMMPIIHTDSDEEVCNH